MERISMDSADTGNMARGCVLMAVDKLVDSAQLNSDLTDIADAIRAKTGKSASMVFPSEFVSEIGSISGGGMDWDGYVNSTYPADDIELKTATSIPNWFFANAKGITGISSNSVTAIGLSTNADGRCFMNCTGLTFADFPNCTYIADRAFQGCSGLTQINFPEVTSVGRNGTDAHCFEGCSNLDVLHFPKLKQALGVGVFWGLGKSAKPATVVLPAITSLGSSGSFRTGYVDKVDLGPGLSSLPEYAFYQGGHPTVIIFRNASAIVTASAASSIYNLDANTTIYIRKTIYDELGTGSALDYKAATNWASIANIVTWAQIEGSIYENYYADGTPIPMT